MHCAGATSAYDLLLRDKSSKKIITFCAELDEILGGGIHLRQVTEICKALAALLKALLKALLRSEGSHSASYALRKQKA